LIFALFFSALILLVRQLVCKSFFSSIS